MISNKGVVGLRDLMAAGLWIIPMTTCFGLGFWQVKRLRWKEDLLSQFRTSLNSTPIRTSSMKSLSEFVQSGKYQLEGEFEDDKVVLVGPSTFKNTKKSVFGFQVIRVLRLGEGGRVLVNTGILPYGTFLNEGQEKAPLMAILDQSDTKPTDIKSDDGLYLRAQRKNYDRIGMALGCPECPALRLLASEASNGLARPDPLALISNRHLEYALTWFGLGLGASYFLLKRMLRLGGA